MAGDFKFCLTNTHKEAIKLGVKLRAGVDARDWSKVAKKKHMKKIDVTLKKMENLMGQMHSKLGFIIKGEELKMYGVDEVSFKIVSFSIITLVVLFVLTCMQMYYMKRYLKIKKYI